MDKPMKVKPRFYAVCLGELQRIAREMGYNLLIHGSMDRDMDLVAVPWVNEPKDHIELIQALELFLNGWKHETAEEYLFKVLPGSRSSYIINLHRSGYIDGKYHEDAQYYLDISITPILENMKG